MDDTLDDLFGDGPLAELPTLPDLPPMPRESGQATEKARVSGCSQYVRLLIHVRLSPEYSSESLPGPIRAALQVSRPTVTVSLFGISIAAP